MADKAKDKESKAMMPRKSFLGRSHWESDMDRMMDDFFGRRMKSWWPERWFGGEGMDLRMPAVDLYDDKNDIVVKAELPGVDKENIQVNLTDHTLTIRGEKKKEDEVKEENYYRSERSYGSFVRTVELPAEVQADKCKANFKDGILEIRLPKTEEAKVKGVQVKID